MYGEPKWLYIFPASVCSFALVVGLNRIACAPFKDPTGGLLLASLVAPYAWVYCGACIAPKGRFIVATFLSVLYLLAASSHFSRVFGSSSSLNDISSLLALPACSLAIYHICCDELACAKTGKWPDQKPQFNPIESSSGSSARFSKI
jgi:hypothetical protein